MVTEQAEVCWLVVTQGITFFDGEEDAALLQLLRRWQVAFIRSLTVRSLLSVTSTVDVVLGSAFVAWLSWR